MAAATRQAIDIFFASPFAVSDTESEFNSSTNGAEAIEELEVAVDEVDEVEVVTKSTKKNKTALSMPRLTSVLIANGLYPYKNVAGQLECKLLAAVFRASNWGIVKDSGMTPIQHLELALSGACAAAPDNVVDLMADGQMAYGIMWPNGFVQALHPERWAHVTGTTYSHAYPIYGKTRAIEQASENDEVRRALFGSVSAWATEELRETVLKQRVADGKMTLRDLRSTYAAGSAEEHKQKNDDIKKQKKEKTFNRDHAMGELTGAKLACELCPATDGDMNKPAVCTFFGSGATAAGAEKKNKPAAKPKEKKPVAAKPKEKKAATDAEPTEKKKRAPAKRRSAPLPPVGEMSEDDELYEIEDPLKRVIEVRTSEPQPKKVRRALEYGSDDDVDDKLPSPALLKRAEASFASKVEYEELVREQDAGLLIDALKPTDLVAATAQQQHVAALRDGFEQMLKSGTIVPQRSFDVVPEVPDFRGGAGFGSPMTTPLCSAPQLESTADTTTGIRDSFEATSFSKSAREAALTSPHLATLRQTQRQLLDKGFLRIDYQQLDDTLRTNVLCEKLTRLVFVESVVKLLQDAIATDGALDKLNASLCWDQVEIEACIYAYMQIGYDREEIAMRIASCGLEVKSTLGLVIPDNQAMKQQWDDLPDIGNWEMLFQHQNQTSDAWAALAGI